MILFLFLIATSFILSSIILSFFFISYNSRNKERNIFLSSLGYAVSIIAMILLAIGCYFGMLYWEKGLFEPQTFVKTPAIIKKPVRGNSPFIPKATQPLDTTPKEEKSPKIDNSKSLPA